jgi:hypothetical protein
LCRSFREYVEAKARRSAFGAALDKAGVELPDDAVRLYADSICPDSKN